MRIVDGNGLKSPSEVDRILRHFNPDRILWCSITGLPYMELWIRQPWNWIPKITLWFDDPVIPVEHYGLENVIQQTAGHPDFLYGIWDGYWREQARKRWGIQAHAIHLSADEEEYHPSLDSKFKIQNSKFEVVFIGMLHGTASITQHMEGLPRGLAALAAVTRSRLDQEAQRSAQDSSEKEIPSWDHLWKNSLEELKPKEKILVESESKRDPHTVWQLRWAIWAMAKNAIRIRILRKALEVAPLLIFCEQKQLEHATETEWRSLLGKPENHLKIVDTSDLRAEELGRLYHDGTLQIQATDPQSVQGGIPYRVFQTAASGKTLLTDLRPELVECFEPGKEILGYASVHDFVPALTKALADHEALKEVGRAARVRFEREHTWRHRLETIEGWISPKTRRAGQANLSGAG